MKLKMLIVALLLSAFLPNESRAASKADMERVAKLIEREKGKDIPLMLDAPREIGAVDKMFISVSDGPNGLFVMVALSAPITVGKTERASLTKYLCEQVVLHADVVDGLASGEFHGCGSTSIDHMRELTQAAFMSRQHIYDAAIRAALNQLESH
ncbi:MAG: hypothetical protein KBE09_00830 [Candidatus Pacebacteria bacterium]|nr:hypothetical protein [Candidatus Paceibacterota bacterium]